MSLPLPIPPSLTWYRSFVLQLISLAGLHSGATVTGLWSAIQVNICLTAFIAELSQRFKTDGMLAYVELIQRKEKEIGCDVLTHQKWYVDASDRCY